MLFQMLIDFHVKLCIWWRNKNHSCPLLYSFCIFSGSLSGNMAFIASYHLSLLFHNTSIWILKGREFFWSSWISVSTADFRASNNSFLFFIAGVAFRYPDKKLLYIFDPKPWFLQAFNNTKHFQFIIAEIMDVSLTFRIREKAYNGLQWKDHKR